MKRTCTCVMQVLCYKLLYKLMMVIIRYYTCNMPYAFIMPYEYNIHRKCYWVFFFLVMHLCYIVICVCFFFYDVHPDSGRKKQFFLFLPLHLEKSSNFLIVLLA